MKRVKVLIPFTDSVTGKDREKDDIIEVSEERLAEIKFVNVNMVSVLGDVEPEPLADAKTEKTSAAKKGKQAKSTSKAKATN